MNGFTHETTTSQSTQWYTPAWVFALLGLRFDMDIAAPANTLLSWIPADFFVTTEGVMNREHVIVAPGHGLTAKLQGLLWCNPPFGNDVAKWIGRMTKHRNGILLLPARTDTQWFHEALAPHADSLLFTNGRIAFAGRDGSTAGPGGVGTMFAAFGEESVAALDRYAAGKNPQGRPAGVVYLRKDTP